MEQAYPNFHLNLLGGTRIVTLIPVLLALIAAGIALTIGWRYHNLTHDAPLLVDSTLGELAIWIAGESEEEAPPSLLGSWAKQWAQRSGSESADVNALFDVMQSLLLLWCGSLVLLVGVGIVGFWKHAAWTRSVLASALTGMDGLLFIIPTIEGENALALVMVGVGLLLTVLLVAPGKVTKLLGFIIAISTLLVAWEGAKSFSASTDYMITLPQPAWEYTTYPTLEDSLNALDNGKIRAVFADRNALENFMESYPERATEDTFAYPNLRLLNRLERNDKVLIFPVQPSLQGRISIAVRVDDIDRYTRPAQFIGNEIGAVEADFAVEKYLAVPRKLVLLNLKILNDLNLPHLQSIAEAFLQPARRNGDFLLIRILGDAGLYTLREAVLGFAFGVGLGLLLGTAFAHSPLMERALLPYVVASQTVPILAIAPMVVIWLGASFMSVAVIATYITFFPVTINTLRGLQSPDPTQLELMKSYAANQWAILWKLRFPAALPFIFTALKVSATASVVGAIIGELPSSISGGLGRAILDFSSDYSLISTPKLWATIITAAFVGMIFFLTINLLERVILRRYVRSEV